MPHLNGPIKCHKPQQYMRRGIDNSQTKESESKNNHHVHHNVPETKLVL